MKSIISLVIFLSLSFELSAQQVKADADWSYSYDFIENGTRCVNLQGKIIKNAYFTSTDSIGNYAYISWDKKKYYVNLNGKKLGPYESVNGKRFEEMTPVALGNGGKFAFMYSLKGKNYMNVNGKILGPYPAIDPKSIKMSNGGNYTFSYLASQNSRYVIFNAKKHGPFVNETNMQAGIFDDGTYYFEYSDKQGNYFININGRVHKIDDCEYLDESSIKYYTFLENGKWYLNSAGKILGPHEVLTILSADVVINNVCYKYKIQNDWFISINEVTLGPYLNIEIPGRNLYHGEVYVYRFFTKKGQFLNIDGKILGPYNYTKRITVLDRDNFAFAYESNARWYLNLRGEKTGGSYGLIDDVALDGKGSYAFSHRDKSDIDESNLVINKKVRNSLKGYIDEVFLAPDGRTLLLINNGSLSVNAFDKSYGPFEEVVSLYALEGGEFYIMATDKSKKIFTTIINGTHLGPLEQQPALFIGAGQRYLVTLEKEGKYYLNDSGQICGPYDALTNLRCSRNWKSGNLLTQ